LHQDFPILGICLGHQAIGYAFGAEVNRAENIMHGKTSYLAEVNNDPLFADLTQPIEVMRYHSLVIEKDTLPNIFEVLAVSQDDQEIMAIKHKDYPVYGFQFHPESVGTDTGKQLLANFIKETRKGVLR